MKALKRKYDEGFTLVELMVVVAIIGILSAVAIPNFKKYQAKSKQSEAKLQLAAIYSAETALQADYDSFATCLAFAGYVGATSGNYYGVGFATAGGGNDIVDNNEGGTSCSGAGGSQSFWPANKQVQGNTVSSTGELHASSVASTGDSFTAAASGWISSGATTVDSWTINEDKALRSQTGQTGL